MQCITSKTNEKVKIVAGLLSSKKDRMDKGLFVVEGIRISLDIFRKNLPIKEIYITEKCFNTNKVLLADMLDQSEQVYIISDIIAEKLSDTKSPQGIFTVYNTLENKADIKNGGKYLMLCSLQDPGNIGTIIRSCSAFSIDGLILTEDCPDIYNSKVLRSTMGAISTVNIMVFKNSFEAVNALKEKEIKIFAAVLDENATLLHNTDFSKGCCIMIGNEGRGLTAEEIALADKKVIIPMSQDAESLNAGVAASIFAWELFKNR